MSYSRIKTELILPEELPMIKIHPIKLVQVLVVMITNAKDAFTDNDISRQDRHLIIRADSLGSKTAKISVSDNAGGIHSSIINKVMAPSIRSIKGVLQVTGRPESNRGT